MKLWLVLCCVWLCIGAQTTEQCGNGTMTTAEPTLADLVKDSDRNRERAVVERREVYVISGGMTGAGLVVAAAFLFWERYSARHQLAEIRRLHSRTNPPKSTS